jgi:hypothetical protein
MLNVLPAKAEFVRALGGAPGALLLISPDGVIRYSGGIADVGRLRKTLARYLVRSTATRLSGRNQMSKRNPRAAASEARE